MTYPILTTASRAVLGLLIPAVSFSAYAQSAPDSSLTEFDEIIVTGSPLTRSVDEAITGLSVLSGEELSSRMASTIGETLKYEPGVSSTQFGAGASRPIIRGQGGDRVRVLINGVGSIDASSASPDHAVAAEPAQAERIEVVRGAAVLRYGSSGSGGIVNVLDGRIPQDVPEDGIDGAVRAKLATVDESYEAAGSVDFALGENFVVHLDATYKQADNYDIPGFAESAAFHALEEEEHHDEDEDHEDEEHEDEDHEDEDEAFGTLPNSASESQSYSAGLSYIGSRGYIGASFHSFETDYGIPAGHAHHDEEHEDEDHEDEDEDHEDEDEGHDEDEHGHEEDADVTIGLEQTRFDLNGALNFDGVIEKVQVFAGYADYTHTEFEGDKVGTVFTNEGYEVRMEAIQAEQNGWAAAYGLQIRERNFEAVGEEAFVPPTQTSQLGLYTFHEKELGDAHIEGALRYETTEQDSIDDTSQSFNTLSASIGGDIHVTEHVRLGGTAFRTQRAPTTEELYSNGPHLATQQFEIGDPDLGVETASGVELALRYREGRHAMAANIFYTSYDDFIFDFATDAEEDELTVYQFGASDAVFKGFEVQGDWDVFSPTLPGLGTVDVRFDAQAAYVEAESNGDTLPRIPPLNVLTGIDLYGERYKLRAELDVAAEAEASDTELATDGYSLVNLFASYSLPIGQDTRLLASLNNAFDTEARQHTSFLKDEVPLPGRNFSLAIQAKF